MTPDQLKFVMIDPKMLELSVYNDIPHLITPVIIDPQKANNALKWVVREMEQRYRQMTDMGVKNIQSFNQKFAEFEAKGEIPKKMVQTGFDPVNGQPTYEEKPVAEKTVKKEQPSEAKTDWEKKMEELKMKKAKAMGDTASVSPAAASATDSVTE